ncbi:DUF1254 domain-containing protein, partial [Rhizobium ruizarguesonis]
FGVMTASLFRLKWLFMTPNEKSSMFAIRRRELELAALALAAAALLAPRRGIAANMLERSWEELTGELKDIPDDAREAAAYFLGME